MNKVILSLFALFATASTVYAEQKNSAPAFGETSVTIVDEHSREMVKEQKEQKKDEKKVKKEKKDKKEKSDKKHKKDHAEESRDDHYKSKDALGDSAADHHDKKKETKSKKEYKQD